MKKHRYRLEAIIETWMHEDKFAEVAEKRMDDAFGRDIEDLVVYRICP